MQHPKNCPLHPEADGPLVGHVRARGRHGFEYRVHCPECLEPGPSAPSRDGAIARWNALVCPRIAADKVPDDYGNPT